MDNWKSVNDVMQSDKIFSVMLGWQENDLASPQRAALLQHPHWEQPCRQRHRTWTKGGWSKWLQRWPNRVWGPGLISTKQEIDEGDMEAAKSTGREADARTFWCQKPMGAPQERAGKRIAARPCRPEGTCPVYQHQDALLALPCRRQASCREHGKRPKWWVLATTTRDRQGASAPGGRATCTSLQGEPTRGVFLCRAMLHGSVKGNLLRCGQQSSSGGRCAMP